MKGYYMARDLTQLELLTELESVAEENVNRHLSLAKEWHPHDYVPWDEGRNFAALGGVDWDPEQSQLSEVAKAAMITNLLTEGRGMWDFTAADAVRLMSETLQRPIDVALVNTSRPSEEALGKGRVAPAAQRPVSQSSSSGRQQPVRQTRSKRGKK